jgi:hypothetical protein
LSLPSNVVLGSCGAGAVFQNCTSLTELDISTWKGTFVEVGRFMRDASIKTFDFSGLDCRTSGFSYFVPSDRNGGLTEFKFFKSTTFQTTSGNSINPFLNTTWAPHTNITRESLVSILNSLPNTTGSTYANTNIPFGATNISKLTDNDILIATNKGWTLV